MHKNAGFGNQKTGYRTSKIKWRIQNNVLGIEYNNIKGYRDKNLN